MNSLFRRLYHEQEGQVLYLVAALLIGLLGMAALSIDIGFALHGQRELQASADAAATAGAADISNNDNAQGAEQWAKNYDGETGNNNAIKDLNNVKMASGYPQVQCLTYLKNLNMMCSNLALGNAMAVVETATAPTFFGKLFGINQINLTAKSLSAMKGGTPAPANIMILVDTTPSMDYTDATGDCTSASIPGLGHAPTQEDCAKWGVRTLLDQLAPCPAGLSSCGGVTNGNVQNAVDEVSIITFPGLANTSSQTADYANCQAQSIQQYAYAPATPSSTPPYATVVPLSSDYRTSDSSGLNGGSSPAVKAVDWADGAGCGSSHYGLEVPSNYDTEYSTAIAQAQADLSALANTDPTRASMQSAIILLSDGDATARWCKSGVWCDAGCDTSQSWCVKNTSPGPWMQMDFTSTTPQKFAANECHQAINEAAVAAATVNTAGQTTWVYSIAYASSTLPFNYSSNPNGSCFSDAAPVGTSPIDGCSTLRQIASDPNKFYADHGQTVDNSPPCVSTAHPSIMDLSQIFSAIAGDFYTTRLLPWGTT
jgi:Flp pilus assembly protein TadG